MHDLKYLIILMKHLLNIWNLQFMKHDDYWKKYLKKMKSWFTMFNWRNWYWRDDEDDDDVDDDDEYTECILQIYNIEPDSHVENVKEFKYRLFSRFTSR
jgi:hypothetical protein